MPQVTSFGSCQPKHQKQPNEATFKEHGAEAVMVKQLVAIAIEKNRMGLEFKQPKPLFSKVGEKEANSIK